VSQVLQASSHVSNSAEIHPFSTPKRQGFPSSVYFYKQSDIPSQSVVFSCRPVSQSETKKAKQPQLDDPSRPDKVGGHLRRHPAFLARNSLEIAIRPSTKNTSAFGRIYFGRILKGNCRPFSGHHLNTRLIISWRSSCFDMKVQQWLLHFRPFQGRPVHSLLKTQGSYA
jgi:hypothetical protein